MRGSRDERNENKIEILKTQKDAKCRELSDEMKIMTFGRKELWTTVTDIQTDATVLCGAVHHISSVPRNQKTKILEEAQAFSNKAS